MFLGTRAIALEMTGGRCTGVLARRDGRDFRVAARAVVIADGGFPGDPELFRNHIGPAPELVLQRHAGSANGDGLRMAEAAGAALTRLDRFYGHLMSRDAMNNTGLWPYPQIDAVATAAIVVDGGGRRLLDEGLGGISITNDLARQDDPLCATVICDAAIWESAGRAAQIPPNPQLELGGGTLHRADTIDALARIARLDPGALGATVASYNEAIRAGNGAALSPPRSAKSGVPKPIETAPFFAIPICPGITNTMGGIAIDGRGRVPWQLPGRLGDRGALRRRRLHRRARRRRRARLCRRSHQGLCIRSARRRIRRAANPPERGIACHWTSASRNLGRTYRQPSQGENHAENPGHSRRWYEYAGEGADRNLRPDDLAAIR